MAARVRVALRGIRAFRGLLSVDPFIGYFLGGAALAFRRCFGVAALVLIWRFTHSDAFPAHILCPGSGPVKILAPCSGGSVLSGSTVPAVPCTERCRAGGAIR